MADRGRELPLPLQQSIRRNANMPKLRLARLLGISRNTLKKYLKKGVAV